MVGRTTVLALALTVLACNGPADSARETALVFARAQEGLPVLSDVCSPRGRLFAVGRNGGSGVVLEQGTNMLSEVELPVAVPPLAACWQAEDATLYAVGGGFIVIRDPEGEWTVVDLGQDTGAGSIELRDVLGTNGQVVAVGSVDGEGAVFGTTETGWIETSLFGETIAPLTAAALASDRSVYAIGEQGELVRFSIDDVGRGQGGTRLFSPSTHLSTITASGDDVFAGDREGLVLSIAGGHVSTFDEIPVRMAASGFDRSGNLWMGGDDGGLVRYLRLPSGAISPSARQAEVPDDSDIVAIGAGRDHFRVVVETDAAGQLWEPAAAP